MKSSNCPIVKPTRNNLSKYSIFNSNSKNSKNNLNSTKTTKKVIYKEPEIIIEKNAFNNRKNKKAKSVQKNLTGDDYLGVPRMV